MPAMYASCKIRLLTVLFKFIFLFKRKVNEAVEG